VHQQAAANDRRRAGGAGVRKWSAAPRQDGCTKCAVNSRVSGSNPRDCYYWPAAERRPKKKRSRSGPVSRVLSRTRPKGLHARTAISLGRRLPGASSSLPERCWGRTGPRASVNGARTLCLALLRVGFAEPAGSPRLLVRSYRTVSPLPRQRQDGGPIAAAAVCFLLHFPGPCGRSVLPTTLSYGARTFLS
jgi:hypothetical protein